MLALTRTRDAAELQRIFDEYGRFLAVRAVDAAHHLGLGFDPVLEPWPGSKLRPLARKYAASAIRRRVSSPDDVPTRVSGPGVAWIALRWVLRRSLLSAMRFSCVVLANASVANLAARF
jgi:hypothetical protein